MSNFAEGIIQFYSPELLEQAKSMYSAPRYDLLNDVSGMIHVCKADRLLKDQACLEYEFCGNCPYYASL